jgi:hypothetical protein
VAGSGALELGRSWPLFKRNARRKLKLGHSGC